MTDFPIINAVLSKSQEGHIYHIDGVDFIVHKAGFAYLDLEESINLNTILDFLSFEKSLPQYFHIYDPSEELIEAINNDNRFGTRLRKRVQLRYLENDPPKLDSKKTEFEVAIKPIDSLIIPKLEALNLNLESKFWNGADDFIKNSYGAVIVVNDQPVSICYAASIANGIAEIDVATLPEYQGFGLAKRVTLKFIRQSKKLNLIPNWDCFEDNIPSLKAALKLGFESLDKYLFLSIFNKNKTNEY